MPENSITLSLPALLMLTAEQAAGSFDTSQRRIFQIIETGAKVIYIASSAESSCRCGKTFIKIKFDGFS
jgi:hypothetical protein